MPKRDDVPPLFVFHAGYDPARCSKGWNGAAPRFSTGCELRGALQGLGAGYLALFSRPVFISTKTSSAAATGPTRVATYTSTS